MDTLKINLNALAKEQWSEKESNNVAVVTDFIQHLMNDHDFNYIEEKYGDIPYVQHSRGIPEGLNGLLGVIKQFTKRFPEYTYDVKHIFADGDQVIFHSHATMKKAHRGNDRKGLNIIDHWTVKEGKIVEHWDAIQPIDGFMRFYVWLNGGNVRNSNGLF